MNPLLAPGRLTSGRRTYRGNKLVGGVPNSQHLDGSAGDYVGTTADALRQFFGPQARIIPEADHLHVQGLPPGTFPYYGNQGVAGLINGVDTTAPTGASPVAQPKKPRTLADIARPDPMAPVGLSTDPVQPQAATLGDLVQQMPQGDIPAKHRNPLNLANIAGILGDALMAYGGMQPQFGPAMRQQQEQDREMAFDREKLNATLEAQRQKAVEPPQFVQNLQAYLAMTPEQKRALLQYQDATNPINVSTPQGTQYVPRTASKTINGKTYYSIGGEWYEETE